MINEYNAWIKENKEFLNHLAKHNSLLYDNINDVIKVMNHLNSDKKIPKEIDTKLFLDTGYAYLNNIVTELKLYLTNTFNNDLHLMLEFEQLIFFAFYLDEIKLLIIDNDKYTEDIKEEFEKTLTTIDGIITNKSSYSDDLITEFNTILEASIPADINYMTIPEIFFRVAEELNIY